MDRHITPSATAIIVDGYSTGKFYPAALRKKGLRPTHVASGTEKHSPGLAACTAQAIEHMRHDYEAFFQDWQDNRPIGRTQSLLRHGRV